MNYAEMIKQARKTGKVYNGISLAENIKRGMKGIERIQIRSRCRK